MHANPKMTKDVRNVRSLVERPLYGGSKKDLRNLYSRVRCLCRDQKSIQVPGGYERTLFFA